ADTTYNFAGAAPTGTVSVGKAGAERTLTNVAAGRLSATSTDAVNGSQLYATNQEVNNLDTRIDDIDNGAGIKYFHAKSTLADSSATGTDSIAVGPTAKSTATNSIAIGKGATASTANSVALGDGATTAAAVGTASAKIADTTYNFAGAAPTGTVSVGKAGAERTLTNVAAGRLSATSTDAINGSQLFATNSAIDTLSDDVGTLDQNAVKYDLNGDGTVNYNSVTMGGDTYDSTTKLGGTTITNVARGVDDSDAVNMSQLNETNEIINNFAGDTTNNYTDDHGVGIRYVRTNEAGLVQSDSSAEGQGSTAVGYNATSIGESSLALGREAQANNANDVALGAGSVTDAAVGTSGATIAGTDYDFAGTAPTSTVSVGSVGNERTITNVAAGRLSATSTDAVNGSQLFATNQGVEQNASDITELGDIINNFTGDTTNNYTDVHGVGIRYARTNEAGLAQSDSSAEGQGSTAVGYNATSIGESSLALGREAQANNANDVALGAGSVTDAAVGTSGATIAGTDYDFAGTAPTSTVSVGSVGNERTITNVAAGRLSADSTDAINGSQLFATNSAIDTLNDDVGTLDQNAVKYDLNGDGTVNYNSVTMGGDTYDSTTKLGGTTITNVARGVDDSDAVNMSQLNETNEIINNFAGDTTNNYTDVHGVGIRYVRTNEAGLAQSDSSAEGQGSTAVGYNATSIGESSLALGREAQANNANDVALGAGSVTDAAVGTAGVTIAGTDHDFAGTAPTSTVSVGAVGAERTVTNVAAGRLSATSTDAVNGSQLYATNQEVNKIDTRIDDIDNGAGIKYFHANSTLADSSATGTNSIAVGPEAVSSSINSIAVGHGATASDINSTALGAASNAAAVNSVAIGSGATTSTTGVNAIAIGMGANASVANSVALGNDATTAAAVATAGGTIAGTSYDYAGGAPSGTVSVGSDTVKRTITNVAAGRLSATSTDAVNGSQLYATNQEVNKIDTRIDDIDNGAGIKYFHANSVLADSSAIGANSIAVGPEAVSAATNAIAMGKGAQSNGLNSISIGTGNVVNGNNSGAIGDPSTVNGSRSYSLGNDNLVDANNAFVIGNNVTVGAGLDGTVVLGNGSTASAAVATTGATIAGTDYDFAGIAPTSTVSVGAVGAERTVTNVAAGRLSATSTDAINGSQLFATNQAVEQNASDITDLGDTINNFAGDTTNIFTDEHGVGIRYARTNEAGLVQSDSSAEGQGSTAVGYNATSIGESSLALGREAQANNANDVALGAGSVTDAAVGTTGVTIAGTDYDFAGTAPTSTVSVGSVGNERTITNVAAGRLSADSTDAINGSQLFATNSAIDTLSDDVGNLDLSSVKYDINDDGTVNYNSVTMGGDTYNSVTKTGGTKITNVARGEDDSDAVNM
ncbi:beta strand repeat-containing protein, partial [Pseudomonas schmalbachii]